MILNVRGCSNKLGIIISYLVENEEKTGYNSFNAKKIIVKNKVDMLTAIKKTLKSSRKLSEINASVFVSTINAVGKKNTTNTSLKTIVKSINDENMQPTMLTLSHAYFNNKPLPQIKAINIINDNMYFMIKVGSNYTLEPIKNERIKCMIVTNSLINLYRRIKQGGNFPKINFKKHCISRARPTSDVVRNVYRSYTEDILEEQTPEERVVEITANSRNHFTAIPTFNNTAWCSSPINVPRTEREGIEQREELTEINEIGEWPTDTENTITESPDINEEERIIERQPEEERQDVITEATEENFETPQPTIVNDENEEREEDRPIRINFATITERCINLETQEREAEEERQAVPTIETPRQAEPVGRPRQAGPVERPRQAGPVERPRQTEERRNSFVNYLRNNQTVTFDTFRETYNNSH